MGGELTSIYFISNKKGHIKIGHSNTITKRLNQLQIGNSEELKLLYFIENVPPTFEKHIHRVCENFHINGEWFNPKCIEFLLNHPFYNRAIKKYHRKTR